MKSFVEGQGKCTGRLGTPTTERIVVGVFIYDGCAGERACVAGITCTRPACLVDSASSCASRSRVQKSPPLSCSRVCSHRAGGPSHCPLNVLWLRVDDSGIAYPTGTAMDWATHSAKCDGKPMNSRSSAGVIPTRSAPSRPWLMYWLEESMVDFSSGVVVALQIFVAHCKNSSTSSFPTRSVIAFVVQDLATNGNPVLSTACSADSNFDTTKPTMQRWKKTEIEVITGRMHKMACLCFCLYYISLDMAARSTFRLALVFQISSCSAQFHIPLLS